MGLISKLHEWATGDSITAARLNGNVDPIYNELDGSLDKTNVASNADFDLTMIGDGSANEATQKTTTNPGDSTTQNLPTTLEGEIQGLRHVIERLGTGVDAVRYDGSAATTIMWGDLPARTLVFADSFEGYLDTSGSGSDVPAGWAQSNATGNPTVTLTATEVGEGEGNEVTITGSGADDAEQGISYTFDGLKASTQYLITVRAKATSGDTAQVITNGGASSGDFQDLETGHLSTTSTSYVTLAGIVATDSTPTDLVVQLETTANTDVVEFDDFCLWECHADHTAKPALIADTAQDTSQTYTGAADDWSPDRGASAHPAVTIPGPGYHIEVMAFFTPATVGATTDTLTVTLAEDVDGGGYSTVATGRTNSLVTAANVGSTVFLHYYDSAPTPGSTYTYKLTGSTASVSYATTDARITVKAVRVS